MIGLLAFPFFGTSKQVKFDGSVVQLSRRLGELCQGRFRRDCDWDR